MNNPIYFIYSFFITLAFLALYIYAFRSYFTRRYKVRIKKTRLQDGGKPLNDDYPVFKSWEKREPILNQGEYDREANLKDAALRHEQNVQWVNNRAQMMSIENNICQKCGGHFKDFEMWGDNCLSCTGKIISEL